MSAFCGICRRLDHCLRLVPLKQVLIITRSTHLQLRLKLLEHFFIAIKHVNVYLALYALHPPVGA